MFEGYTFFEHANPIQSGYKGYILNEKGNIIAYIKLDGKILCRPTKERKTDYEGSIKEG